jgi:acyl-coenzyme A synthetase/AMP-(fatty) acid ligase
MPELALAAGFAPGQPLGWRDGRPVTLAAALRAANALAARLPRDGHCINLCDDRLNFIVAFAAALMARATTVLPHSRAPQVLEELRRSYDGAQIVADQDDAAHAGGLRLDARDWPGEGAAPAVPSLPAERCAAVLFTSGSTGASRPHAKSWGSLVRAARAASARVPVAPGSALLGAVPPQHMWGFEMTVMLPLQTGCAVDASCPLLPADIAAALARLPGARWLVATPLHLQACLTSRLALPPLAGVLCATATLSAELSQSVEQAWAAPLWEIYGSTETGALATRRPAHEDAFRVVDGITLHEAADGTEARGGHLDQPQRLGDVVELKDATSFVLRGRTADLVKVAGKRGSIAALTSELLHVPGVRDGAFWLRDGPGETRLAAFAVAPELSAAQIQAALRQRVDPVFLPRPLILVPALPRGPAGKLTREGLNELILRYGHAPAPADGSARWQRVPHAHPSLPHHFPGDPIVPGVWVLSLVEEAARERFGAGLRVRGVPEARFRRILRPGEAYRIELTRVAPDRLEFVVESARARIADGKLLVQEPP